MSLLNFIRERKAKHTVSILVEQKPSFALEVAKDFLDLDRKGNQFLRTVHPT
ncbi:MAG: hypothetical protein QGI00_00045 [Candidatus Marinimicrobia bacterium]|nr:hypothetical protein [Candidatus Neomarinimicrobiota bacterium]